MAASDNSTLLDRKGRQYRDDQRNTWLLVANFLRQHCAGEGAGGAKCIRERVNEGPERTRERVTGKLEQNSFDSFSHAKWPIHTIGRYASTKVNAEGFFMLGWALTFLIIALIAGVLGFGGIAVISIEMAKIVFFVAIILFLASVIVGFLRGRSAPMP